MISASVDDRSPLERGLLGNSTGLISKSRYDSISLYLSPGPVYSGGCCSGENDGVDELGNSPVRSSFFKPEFNDLKVSYDSKIFEQLKEGGNTLD